MEDFFFNISVSCCFGRRWWIESSVHIQPLWVSYKLYIYWVFHLSPLSLYNWNNVIMKCIWYLKSISLSDPLVLMWSGSTQHMHPQRRSQSLAVLLTSLHSGPPLTQSRSIQQIYCSADEDLASTLITDLPLSVRVSGVERKGCLQAEGETLNKWTWPADVGVPPSSFTPACPERWDCVMPRLFPRLGSGRNGEKERERDLDLSLCPHRIGFILPTSWKTIPSCLSLLWSVKWKMLAFLMEWRLLIDLYQNIHVNPWADRAYFQARLAITASRSV